MKKILFILLTLFTLPALSQVTGGTIANNGRLYTDSIIPITTATFPYSRVDTLDFGGTVIRDKNGNIIKSGVSSANYKDSTLLFIKQGDSAVTDTSYFALRPQNKSLSIGLNTNNYNAFSLYTKHALTVVNDSGNNDGITSFVAFGGLNTAPSTSLHHYSSRGRPGAPQPLMANDFLLSTGWRGANSTSVDNPFGQSSFAFQVIARENFNTTHAGTKLRLQATDTGAGLNNPRTTIAEMQAKDTYWYGKMNLDSTLNVNDGITTNKLSITSLKDSTLAFVNNGDSIISDTSMFWVSPSTKEFATGGSQYNTPATGYDKYSFSIINSTSGVNRTFQQQSFGGGAVWHTRSANGTQLSPTALTSGGTILSWGFQPWGSRFFGSAAAMIVTVRENITDTTAGTRIRFQCTKLGGDPNNFRPDVLDLYYDSVGVNGKFVARTSGRFGATLRVGATSDTTSRKFETINSDTTHNRGILFGQYSASRGGSQLIFRKSRGSFTSPTTQVVNDTLSTIISEGYDGSNYIQSTSIRSFTEGTVASTRMPGVLGFYTATNVAPSVMREAMRINSSQNVSMVGDISVDSAILFKSIRTNTSTTNNVFSGDFTILEDATTGNITVNLPPAATNKGRILNIKKVDSTGNTVTIDANASERIDGALTQVISTQYTSLQIQCDGSNWYIL